MLIGICGAICAGKHSVLDYLVTQHDFQVLALASDEQDSSISLPRTRHIQPITTFPTIDRLLTHATRDWRKNFVTVSIHSTETVDILSRRPCFLLLHVDAPVTLRWQRYSALHTPPPSLESFITLSDTHLYSPPHPLAALSKRASLTILNSATSTSTLRASLDKLNLPDPTRLRPTWDHYFMTLASLAARRSNCMRRQVGCVLVRNSRILATGYNGTPRGVRNCSEGGCPRCNNAAALDTCLCIHAEENALLEAGRERIGDRSGPPGSGAVLYCNTCPCLTCTMKIVQVGIAEVVFSQSYYMDAEAAKVFEEAGVKLRQFDGGLVGGEGVVDVGEGWGG
ncbi:uncharacterized protein MYCGRDRAFT_72878 [Zymoseptoria tritici IPO323]|uniref:Deoxycytidylate deaminase n=1 Tax=Zymoseptoria tritici (strain CBS 115943 / IPO323) TaxID=336722 RepID=F9XCU7_ZYMTI|nr:uncharacterized protein MYCGRDRAFT_72878 [Zymoseptoria tritici IPO323]EGP86905.1 hypothetical protein MYCGRDRAFT_72878 [Zymoseptoria tritici IPO323]